MIKRKNYLNNKDILNEIHKSKLTFCSFIDEKYSKYDVIANDKNDITFDFLYNVRSQLLKEKKKISSEYNLEDIPIEGLVVRVMEHEHIPYGDEKRINKAKTELNKKVKLNFPPFKHYYVKDLGNEIELIEVGKSHWKNGIHNGYFSQDHGQITDNFANMLLKLVDKYSEKGNYRNYSYLEEMKGQAIIQLIQVALQFNESKSDNPFSYLTTIITNSFRVVLNTEKKNQNIRDDILESNNITPSYTRQNDNIQMVE